MELYGTDLKVKALQPNKEENGTWHAPSGIISGK